MLGQSDIFNLGTVSAYYTVSSMIELLFTRSPSATAPSIPYPLHSGGAC